MFILKLSNIVCNMIKNYCVPLLSECHVLTLTTDDNRSAALLQNNSHRKQIRYIWSINYYHRCFKSVRTYVTLDSKITITYRWFRRIKPPTLEEVGIKLQKVWIHIFFIKILLTKLLWSHFKQQFSVFYSWFMNLAHSVRSCIISSEVAISCFMVCRRQIDTTSHLMRGVHGNP